MQICGNPVRQKMLEPFFVVHGRNEAARKAMFEFLIALDLHPLEWSESVTDTGKASPYIGEILDAAFSRAHAIVVLFTPDDEARLREPFPSRKTILHTRLSSLVKPDPTFCLRLAWPWPEARTGLYL